MRYGLVHQQLEAMAQLEYEVGPWFGAKSEGQDALVGANTCSRRRVRSCWWEREAEGSTNVFDGVLCEVSAWRSGIGSTGIGDPRNGMQRWARAE